MPLPTARAYDSTSASVGQTPVAVTLVGVAGIPADAIAVALNLEVSAPTAGGYVRVTPFHEDASVASQEFKAGQTISNLLVVKLNEGQVQVHVSAGRARILMDVAGYYTYSPGSLFTPVATTRVYDSLSVSVGSTPVPVPLAGVGVVPADATAVVVNTEVYQPTNSSYVRVTPFGQDASVAAQEFSAGQTISNLVVVELSAGKAQVSIHAGKARILMDVAGYYTDTTGSTFVPVPTTRVYDSTTSSVGPTPVVVTLGGVAVSGTVPVPADATAVVVNTEVYQPAGSTYVRVTPYGQDAGVATQEFSAGQSLSNLVTVEMVRGKVQVSVHVGTARILMDVAGYYTTKLTPPVDLAATASTTTSITLGWTAPGSPLITGEQVRRATGPVPPATESDGTLLAELAPGTATYQDTGLTVGATYSYTVFTEDATPENAGTSVITATEQFGWTAPQTIDPVQGVPRAVSCVAIHWCMIVDDANAILDNNGSMGTPVVLEPEYEAMTGVSCVSTTMCVAVADNGDAYVFNGVTWGAKALADPSGLVAVSCISTIECWAVDSFGQATLYNGSSWSDPQMLDPNGLNSISCIATTLCIAAGPHDVVQFDGAGWSAPVTVDGNKNGITSVSCATVGFCMAVDGTGSELDYTGGSWSGPFPIALMAGHGLSSVYCTTSECVAVGSGVGLYYNGGWQSGTVLGQFGARAVACTGVYCLGVGGGSDAFTFFSGAWNGTAATIENEQGYLQGVSCPSPTFCNAVDFFGSSMQYTGSWTSPKNFDGTNEPFQVSCSSASSCMAVDNFGDAIPWSAGTWGAPVQIDPTQTLWDLSCRGGICVTVNLKGTAFFWNGSGWSSQMLDATAPGNFAAVSCASGTFCLAGFDDGKVYTLTVSGWTGPTTLPAGFQLLSLGCAPASTFCLAASPNSTLTYSAGTWSTTPLAADGTGFIAYVRCESSTQCVAVDGGGQAMEFNGTSWSGPQQLFNTARDGTVGFIDVSCPALNTCVSVSGTDFVTSA